MKMDVDKVGGEVGVDGGARKGQRQQQGGGVTLTLTLTLTLTAKP